MDTKNAIITLNGSGNCEIAVSDKIKITISGSGNLLYKGNPEIESNISGSGSIKKL